VTTAAHRRGAVVLVACALSLACCDQHPDLVGSVVQQPVVSGAGAPGDAGTPGGPPPGDPRLEQCPIADLFSNSFSAFASIVAVYGCEIPYSWLSNPPSNVVDPDELQAFLDRYQPAPPWPGAMLEEPCGPWGGVYLDDENNPTKIILCEVTCNALESLAARELEQVLMACEALAAADEDAGT